MRAPRSLLIAGLVSVLASGSAATALASTHRPAAREALPGLGVATVTPRTPTQIAVFDRQTRTTSIVSNGPSGAPGANSSSRPALSGDGNVIAFESDAQLLTADGNRRADIYAWQRPTNSLQLISVGLGGAAPNGASHEPSTSFDGGVIAFSSTARNLTGDAGLDGTSQVFARLATTGEIRLVSVGESAAGSGASGSPSVSPDGRVVAFESAAGDLVEGDTNGVFDVFLRNLTAGATIRASVASDGAQVAGTSRRPSLAGDGGVVSFDSTAARLAPGDSNKVRDVFVRDLPPAVQATPNPLDFGAVPLGTPASLGVTVVSIGWTPVSMTGSVIGGTNAGDFVVAGDACTGLTLDYGGSCTIMILDIPLAPGPRTATLSITNSALDSPQVVTLLGGVGPPTVRFDPPVGPPGIVTTARGVGFPPGALVALRWDRGITGAMAPVTVGADGSFVVSILVFHNDVIGPRLLNVTAAPGGASFDDQTAPFLVVTGTLQPSGLDAVSFVAPELQLILIRR